MADKPTYEFIPSPNYRTGRANKVRISAIVIHYTTSLTIEATVEWFKNRQSQVSAHYVVGRDGRVVQMVDEKDTAWHSGHSELQGVKNVNAFSIGIELVGTGDSGFTDRQLASLYSLLEILVFKYRILPERVVGHCHVSPGRKIDPDGFTGQFNWAKARQVSQSAYNEATKGKALLG
jgi:N-acetylmuramoyl-L-alanine amidase